MSMRVCLSSFYIVIVIFFPRIFCRSLFFHRHRFFNSFLCRHRYFLLCRLLRRRHFFLNRRNVSLRRLLCFFYNFTSLHRHSFLLLRSYFFCNRWRCLSIFSFLLSFLLLSLCILNYKSIFINAKASLPNYIFFFFS